MSYHFTYQIEKDKPKTLRTDSSIQQHKCACMVQNLCKCLCHQVSPHLSPNHSNANPSIDHTAPNQLNCNKEIDYDYYQKLRKDRCTKRVKSQQPSDDESFINHNEVMANSTINRSSSPNKFKAQGSQSMGSIFKQNQKEDNKKIQLDLETFNQELLALKHKLANEKKDIPRPHEKHLSINTTNASNTYMKLGKESFYFTIRSCYDYKNPIEETDLNRDLIIEELKLKLFELNELIKLYKRKDGENELKISRQYEELDSIRRELVQWKGQVSSLKKKEHNTKRYGYDSQLIRPIKCDCLSYAGHSNTKPRSHNKAGKKQTMYEDSSESIETKLIRIGGSKSGSSCLMKKMQFNNQTITQSKKLNYRNNNKIQLSNSLVFKVYDNKSILYFDIESKKFALYHYADYGNFEDNYIKDSSLYLTHSNVFYIVTGKNSDMLYSYNAKGNKMSKLCSLLNNHTKGTLIEFTADSGEDSLICVGSSFNKKAEMYSIEKNNWRELPELNEERSECSCVIINNSLLYALFGFNSVLNKYVELIECLDLSNGYNNNALFQWEFVQLTNKQNIPCDIKGSLAINYNNQKIIMIGGVEGSNNNPLQHFYQLTLQSKDEFSIEKAERKYNDINKNKLYSFSSGFTSYEDEKNRNYNIAFDDKGVLHMFEINQMTHDVFYFE